jgi:hypothetical protein
MRGGAILTVISAAALVAAGELQPAALAAAPRASSPVWSIETPVEPTLPNGLFNGVACAASTYCMAVGQAGIPNTTTPNTATLSALWNGTSWTPESVLEPKGAVTGRLDGVACASTSSCVAVGSYVIGTTSYALTESWNGSKWTVISASEPKAVSAAQLQGVSCVSATSCIAVGSETEGGRSLSLAESWNGKTWTALKTSSPSSTYNVLYGVSCQASSCVAVGTDGSGTSSSPLAETWNGKTWTASKPLTPKDEEAILTGVSCPSAADCVAVGTYLGTETEPLLESWNGSSWTYMKAPSAPFTFAAVSCSSTEACMEVGQTLGKVAAASWNGKVWKVTSAPASSPANVHPGLNGVSCTGAAGCVAVGENVTPSTTAIVTLAAVWNGSRWKVGATPDPPGPTAVTFTAVSCQSPTACFASGYYYYNRGTSFVVPYYTYLGLVETWNGTAWKVISTSSLGSHPYPYDNTIDFDSACVSSADCVVDGGSSPMSWNGKSWTGMPLAGGAISPQTAVACAGADHCFALGSYLAGDVSPAPFIDSWNGAIWSWQAAPVPNDLVDSALNSVSCVSSTSCETVGYYFRDKNFKTLPLADRWNGSDWALQTMPNPHNSIDTEMTSVSCSKSMCMSVGSWSSGNEPVAERWNGSAWTVEPTPLPEGNQGGELSAVFCDAPSSCLAVGSYANEDFDTLALTETWNGTTWSVDTAKNPAPDLIESGVACSSSSACTAVGDAVERYAG